ncbi:MAG: hypothetical protein CMI56_00755 [Parcubacteria group bacterium]|nr:hypothetical protein [Parcubacteria group bacterium]|tara:strand:- start:1041 stop:1406 length:366 start_codon:yes stop_codon:yes gene_type:complete
MNTLTKLRKLKTFMEEAASIDTAYNKEYDPNDLLQRKMHNHCGCASFVVQMMYGGQIVSMKRHYWNKIEDTLQIDMTMVQGITNPRYSVYNVCPPRKHANMRFQKFYDRVVNLLHEYPEIL